MNNLLPHGRVRGAVLDVLRGSLSDLRLKEIEERVESLIGETGATSVRSSLQHACKKGEVERTERGWYKLKRIDADAGREAGRPRKIAKIDQSALYQGDCFAFLEQTQGDSISAIVTDPPYGLVEFTDKEKAKLRAGKGGVWRIPPSFDGVKRAPLPRFTILGEEQRKELREFFQKFGAYALPALKPGANVIIASNPLLQSAVIDGMTGAAFEHRGAITRLVMTMRGGDRPKNAHTEFPDVSVMPRSMWEPWLCFRKPLDGTVAQNLRKWRVGGFRRISDQKPFGDVIASHPTRAAERKLAPHPSLKPQSFMRQIVRASLALGEGVVLDPFAGGGSTLAAANFVGYDSVGIERDSEFAAMASAAIEPLSSLVV